MKRPLLFIDSGAYSAKTKDGVIDLAKYVEFLKTEPHDVSAALDVIYDAPATHANQAKMESMGVRPIPTFHIGEPMHYLKAMVEQYDYIGIGGTATRAYSVAERMDWLETIWEEYLTDADGLPVVKVHGFAATGAEVMRKFPWFSVDSTSWIMSAANGSALVPSLTIDGRPDLAQVAISSGSSASQRRDGHMETMTPLSRDAAEGVLRAHGYDAKDLAEHYLHRFHCNADAYARFAEMCVYTPYRRTRGFLFGGEKKTTKKALPAWDHITFYFAGNPGSVTVTEWLMKERGYNRLLSYYYIGVEKALLKHFTTAKEIIRAYQA